MSVRFIFFHQLLIVKQKMKVYGPNYQKQLKIHLFYFLIKIVKQSVSKTSKI
jgi:hypothetical protein